MNFRLINRFLTKMSNLKLKKLDFEVFGRVQGVFFRKHTQQEANKLGLKGWCRNTEVGTVKGVIEGTEESINKMKNWLQHKGSPKSKIDKAVFSEEKEISKCSFSQFKIEK